MNELDIKSLPLSIRKYLDGLKYSIDNIGKSNSLVYIFDDYVLKISSLSFDYDNEVIIYEQLKDKIPIPELLAYEKIGDTIYLLKRKIKGKMLCDEEYLKNPKLLFKLAAEAVRILWSVDVSKLRLQDTYQTVYNFGKKICSENIIDFENTDRQITKDFNNFDDLFNYLDNHKPKDDLVLVHGDLCITNIICNEDKLVGFIDLGLMGVGNRYEDLAILYRSIKYNFLGKYGRSYHGFDENTLFDELQIKRDDEQIKYYLLLDEILG